MNVKQPKNCLKYTAFIFGIIIFLLAALRFAAKPVDNHLYFNRNEFMIIAHRGGQMVGPEHTLYTYKRAASLGVHVLEIDVQFTKDRHLVVVHDNTVDRTTNGSGRITDYDLIDLQKLDAAYHWTPDNGESFPLRGKGIHVPSLADVFKVLPNIRINIEIKEPSTDLIDTLCFLIKDYNMQQMVMIASYKTSTLKMFRSSCPDVATSAGASEVLLFYVLHKMHLESVYSPTSVALQVPINYGALQVVSQRFVKAAHKRGLRVQVWMVNDKDTMNQLKIIGVDGVITDFPQRLLIH
jgi:glycerophosphoryl diester phosphodiesterase